MILAKLELPLVLPPLLLVDEQPAAVEQAILELASVCLLRGGKAPLMSPTYLAVHLEALPRALVGPTVRPGERAAEELAVLVLAFV